MMKPFHISIKQKLVCYIGLIVLYLACFNTPLLHAQESVVEEISGSIPIEQAVISAAEEAQQIGANPEWPFSFGRVFWTIVIFIGALVIIRYLTRTLESMAERSTYLRLAIKRLIPLISMIGWAVVIYLIIANVFALPWQTVVAIAASAGIAIGFASQDILKNIFGGIMILLDRPFQVGDKIEIGSYYGEVVQIGLRSVRIVTLDDSLVSIPNGEVMNQSVSNSNAGESNAQVVSEFFLPPDIDLIKAKKIAYRAAAVSRYVYLNKPIAVIIKNEIHQGRSLLKMRLKAYVLDIRYEAAFASEMTEIVLQEFLRANLIAVEELTLAKSSASRLWPF
jgi:small-conductance mechanosensitive channel